VSLKIYLPVERDKELTNAVTLASVPVTQSCALESKQASLGGVWVGGRREDGGEERGPF
jgi:hypothetical protein